jgi:hypothetical protein
MSVVSDLIILNEWSQLPEAAMVCKKVEMGSEN